MIERWLVGMAGATQIDLTAQGEYVGSEEERFKMEQGG